MSASPLVQPGSPPYRYLEEEQLPLLVLAHEHHRSPRGHEVRLQQLHDPAGWQLASHQTAGIGCHQHHLLLRPLQPKSVGVLRAMLTLTQRWYDSQAGIGGPPPLAEALRYRADLAELLGVDCNSSYHRLEEGFYPIDLTAEHLAALTDEPLPARLDDLVEWASPLDRACGMLGRWQLLLLGSNSD